MSQADGYNTLKRISLNLKTPSESRWYNFKINPEEYQEQHPQRSNVFRTREAVVLEDFGPDVSRVSFSGTTGFRYMQDDKIEGNRVMNGAARLFRLEKLINDYALSSRTSEPGENPNNAELIFYNNTDGKAWYVHLDEDGFMIERSADESLLYRYSLSFIILRKSSDPLDREIDGVDIGNPVNDDNFHLHPDTIPGNSGTSNKKPAKNPNSSNSFYQDYLERSGQLVGIKDSPVGSLPGMAGSNQLARPQFPWMN